MNEIQQLLAAYNELEKDMQRFSVLVKEVMTSVTLQEFVPEKANTEMMQCIMELNTKQKECLKLYKQANIGDVAPKKMRIMREQIEKRMKENRKLEYLEAVKKSFLSLYTEDAEVEEKLQGFKDKVVTIKVDKYPLEKCLVYIRPFAVFLTMIKSDDPVKAIEQVPVLNEYFGSALVAHITISKDIFIGEDATEFNMDGEEASDQPKDSAGNKESVQSAESIEKKADTAKEQTTKTPVQNVEAAGQGTIAAQTAPVADKPVQEQAAAPQATPEVETPAQEKETSQAKPTAEAPAQEQETSQATPEAEASAQEQETSQATPEAEASAQEQAAPQATPAAEAPVQEQTAPQAEAVVEAPVQEQAAPQATPVAESPAQEVAEPQEKKPETKKKEAPVAKQKRVHPDSKKRSRPKQPKKVDLKALLEEEGFREDKLDDPELKQMQEQGKKGKKGKKDSNASVLRGTSNLGHL